MKVLSIFSSLFIFVVCKYDYSCDYKFGDPTWNYSEIFYNTPHAIEPGTKKLEILLKSNLIISFVCVNLTNVDLNSTKVSFSSLLEKLTIELNETYVDDIVVDVLAMHHGYRRRN